MISDMIMMQTEGYITCLVMGLCVGAVAGLISAAAHLCDKAKPIVWICDITLWLIICVSVSAVLYICSDGNLRLYIFLGFFSGFLLSFFTINWGALKIVNKILCFTREGLKKVSRSDKKSR